MIPSAFWAAFLGQQTQTIPAVVVRSNRTGRRRTSASYDVWKLRVTSTDFGQPGDHAGAAGVEVEAGRGVVEEHDVLVLDPDLPRERGARVAGHP